MRRWKPEHPRLVGASVLLACYVSVWIVVESFVLPVPLGGVTWGNAFQGAVIGAIAAAGHIGGWFWLYPWLRSVVLSAIDTGPNVGSLDQTPLEERR